jgi:FkbM family methyltransferase
LWIATAGRGLHSTLPQGEQVRIAPACRQMSWNLEEYEALRLSTRPGDVVFDVGANVGAYTVLFAQWVGPAGHVFAFEPVPSIARSLRAQLALNRMGDRVTVIEAAVINHAGTLALSAPGHAGINRRALPQDDAAQRLVVPAVSLDLFCAERGVVPGLIKIDVEGAELDVLRGARDTLAAMPGRRVFIEWHPSLWPAYGVTVEEIQQELLRHRLHAEPLRGTDDVWSVEGICARLTPMDPCES